MYCVKCGSKLEENAKFCPNCGMAVKNTKISKPNKEGSIRKEIKKEARMKNKTPLVLAALLVLVIIACMTTILYFAFGVTITNDLYLPWFLEIIYWVVILAASIVLGFGLSGGALKLLRGEEVTFSSVLTSPFCKIKKVVLFYLLFVVFFAAYFLLLLVPGINFLVALSSIIGIPILFIYFYPVLDMYMYLVMDENKDMMSFASTLKQAYNIVKGHRVEYYGMILSFIGWFLLGALTLGILYIWLIPYVRLSVANLYRKWTDEVTITGTENGMSNGTVIGITVGSYFGLIFLMFIIVIILVMIGVIDENLESNRNNGYDNNYYNYYDHDYYNYHDNYNDYRRTNIATLTYGNDEISFIVPDDFTEDTYNTNSYQTYIKKTANSEESITYSLAYSYGNYYENTIADIREVFSSDLYEFTEDEYTINLDNKETKCYEINVTNVYGVTGKFTEVFYPVTDTRYVTIEIISENVSQNNIEDYVQIK